MMRLHLIVPPSCSVDVADRLAADPTVANLLVLPGAGRSPIGDAVQCDVTREAVAPILSWLRELGIHDNGGISVSDVDGLSTNTRIAERIAPGAPDDAVVWDVVVDRAYGEVRGSWSFYAFMILATMIASVAVVTDSSILVVGAMVVGPEFALVAALATGLALWDRQLTRRSLILLAKGFGLAVAVTVIAALLVRSFGWIEPSSVTAARPLTGFIWRPDHWSVVVAVLAGCAGVLSQTAGRSNALVGVFISVTTIPAAGDFALSLALWSPRQMGGSAAQLGINLVGMTIAGVLTLLAQRWYWHRVAPPRV